MTATDQDMMICQWNLCRQGPWPTLKYKIRAVFGRIGDLNHENLWRVARKCQVQIPVSQARIEVGVAARAETMFAKSVRHHASQILVNPLICTRTTFGPVDSISFTSSITMQCKSMVMGMQANSHGSRKLPRSLLLYNCSILAHCTWARVHALLPACKRTVKSTTRLWWWSWFLFA